MPQTSKPTVRTCLDPGIPVLLLAMVLLATVLFDVVAGRLAQVTMSAHPAPAACDRTGEHPGLGIDEESVN